MVTERFARFCAAGEMTTGTAEVKAVFVELIQTADILASLSERKGDRIVIGFAAETGDAVGYGQAKLARKGCDAIVANDVSRADSGFGSDTDKAWWITRTGAEELPVLSKDELAREILLRALRLMGK